MKKFYRQISFVLLLALLLSSCTGGGSSSGTVPSGGGGILSKTTTVSGTVFLSGAVSASSKPTARSSYKVTKTGSQLDKTLGAAGVKSAVLPPLVNATMKLYNADRPDWIYPVAQVFTDANGTYTFNKLTNADLNLNAQGQQEYSNGDPIPAGNYTVIAANDTTVSGGKQYVAVQAIVKRFEGFKTGNDLVVQDSDAIPSVIFMLGLKPNSDGTFGGTGTILPPNAGIQIVFNMAMARLSVIDAVKLYSAASTTMSLAGSWKFTPDLLTATFYPTNGMQPSTAYTVKIAGGANNVQAAVNVYGKPLASTITAAFITDSTNDTTRPNAILYLPILQTDVPITTPIQIASRYEPLDINTMNVTGTPSIGDKPAVHYVGIKRIQLTSDSPVIDYYIYEIGHTPLDLGTDYVITVSDAKDMSGNLLQPVSFNFKTESTSSGITGAINTQLRTDQIAVKDVFGKWINAMNTRNAALLTTYMTGDFFWLVNGWSEDDRNRDGRLDLNEFRSMLQKSFETYDYCDSTIDGDTSSITIDSTTASIQFTLTTTAHQNLADPECASTSQTLYADLKNINSGWLIYRGADSLPTSYPAALDIIELSSPGNGAQFPEPTASQPLNPIFIWKAVSNVTTYALVLMEAGSNDTGWVALIDGASVAAGDQMSFTFTGNTGYADVGHTQYVLPSGQVFGFNKSITKMKPGGYYHWAVLGLKTYTLANFEQGTATDVAGDLSASSPTNNFWVLNNAPPSVISVEPANTASGISTQPTITVVFSEAMLASSITNTTIHVVSQGGQTVSGTVHYDDASYTATFVAASLDYETLYNATITTDVRDIAGNSLAVPYTWAFTTKQAPDTTAPVTTASPAGGTYNSTVNVVLSANEQVKYIKYSTTVSSPTTTYTGPIPISANTTLKFFAEDLAGNQETVKTETYTIDSTKPITNVSPPGGYFNTKPLLVTLTTESGAKIYYTIDGSDPSTALASSTTTTTVTINSTGNTQLKFFAADSAGNAENVRTEAYVIDTTAPETNITTNPDNPTRSKYANFTFSSNESDVTFECSVNGATFTSCSSPYSQALATQGTYTFNVRAKDRAGNYDASPASYSWIYDVTPPTGSIGIVDLATLTTRATTTSTSVKLQISATDNLLPVDQMQLSHDGQAWYDPVSYNTSMDWTLISGDGTKAVFVRFKDTAGNWSGPYGDTIVLDTVAPDTTITQSPPSPSGQNVTFAFSASEQVDHFECRIDNGSWESPCSSPKTYSNLADSQTHTFDVRAVDVALLVDPTPATKSWKVDTQALITVASPVGGLFNIASSPVSVTLTATGIANGCSTETYYCTVPSCSPGTLYTGAISINTSSTLRYYSKETTGCTGSPEDESSTSGVKEQVYTLDLTEPNTTITSGTQGTVASSSATFYFTGSDNSAVAYFECQLDSGGYTQCSSPITYTGLLSGSTHTFYVRAKDTAGNVDSSPATMSWTVDLTGPTGGNPAVSINAGATYANSTAVTLTLSATDSSGISYVLVSNDATSWYWNTWTGSPMSLSWSLTPGDGTKVVYVQFRDALGNMSSTYTDSIILDSVAPQTTISSAPSSPTTSRTVYFYFYASEASTFECNTNGGSWSACSSPAVFSLTYDGTNTFYVRAKDLSGQYDPTPASYTWTLFTGYWDSPGIWDTSSWGN